MYKNDKLIQKFEETHNITSFSRKEIVTAIKGKFKIINNCIWYDRNKKPQTKDFTFLCFAKNKLIRTKFIL